MTEHLGLRYRYQEELYLCGLTVLIESMPFPRISGRWHAVRGGVEGEGEEGGKKRKRKKGKKEKKPLLYVSTQHKR